MSSAAAPELIERGPRRASRLVLLLVGVRGHFAVAGSHVARACLAAPAIVDEDTRILVAHGVDPWASRRCSPTTYDGIDLDRNFVDFSSQLPHNAEYDRLHAALVYTRLDGALRREADAALHDHRARLTTPDRPDPLPTIVDRGQYEHADGLGYGGRRPAAAHEALDGWIDLAEVRGDARHVDVWTVESGEARWGRMTIDDAAAGSLGAHLCRRWSDVTVRAKTARLGTFGPTIGLERQRDAALVRLGADRRPAAKARVRSEMLEHCAPADAGWLARIEAAVTALV